MELDVVPEVKGNGTLVIGYFKISGQPGGIMVFSVDT
jgi:hypothetical protein